MGVQCRDFRFTAICRVSTWGFLGVYGASIGFSWVCEGVVGFYMFCRVVHGLQGFYRFCVGFIGLYRSDKVCIGFVGFYRVCSLQDFTGLHRA